MPEAVEAPGTPSNGGAAPAPPQEKKPEPVAEASPEPTAAAAYDPQDETTMGEGLGPAPKEDKRTRAKWKKKEVPGGLWLKCESCSGMIYRKELEDRGMVCPSCDFHFTLPGQARVALLLDPGTWVEHFADLTALDRLDFTDTVKYAEKISKTVQRTGQKEALLLGTGRVDGRPIVLAVLDFTFMGGSMGEVVGEKIALAADLARTRRETLVIFTSSGGARMHEGMFSLMQMAKTSAAIASLNDSGGFSICVLTHPTTGGVTASFASVCDVTLAEPGALIGFAGPRVIATTIKQELPPGFQRAEFLLEKGQIDGIVRRDEMRSAIARLVDFGRGAFAMPPAKPPAPPIADKKSRR
ncbi:MAG: acetyl-CoA carboxylase, carboxyltransferase subunit beta [Planctomycetota bacterium]